MGNRFEEGTQRLVEQEELGESYKEIFSTAINILRTNGQQSSAENFFNGRQTTYHVFLHAVADPWQDAVDVKIVAGVNLAKARKASIHVVGMGRLDVRKTSVKGQERFNGKLFRATSPWGKNLNGRWLLDIDIVRDYLSAIKRVSGEIISQPH